VACKPRIKGMRSPIGFGRLYEDGAAGSPDCAELQSGSAVLLSSQSQMARTGRDRRLSAAFRRLVSRSTSRRGKRGLGCFNARPREFSATVPKLQSGFV